MKNKFFIFSLLSLFVLFASSVSFAFMDYSESERIINENKSFIDFMDVSVTNLAEEKADAFRDIYEIHFNADLAYMQGKYMLTYKKVYASQKDLADLCHSVLKEKYLDESKKIMGAISLTVAKSKNAKARTLLALGYRDLANATDLFTMGDGSYRKHFSTKIAKYVESIRLVRRAQRFSYFALFESLNSEGKRAVYNEMVKQEKEQGRGLFYSRFLDKEGDELANEILISYEDAEKRDKDVKKDPNSRTFERKIDRHIRFKREARVAELMGHDYFSTAEEILRNYIYDFNFKLLDALLTVLSNDSENKNAPKFDYTYIRLRLVDNYGKHAKDSLLDSFRDNVKVDDDNISSGEAIQN